MAKTVFKNPLIITEHLEKNVNRVLLEGAGALVVGQLALAGYIF